MSSSVVGSGNVVQHSATDVGVKNEELTQSLQPLTPTMNDDREYEAASDNNKTDEQLGELHMKLDIQLLIGKTAKDDLFVVQGLVNKQPAVILIDCGATVNFISTGWLRKHEIEPIACSEVGICLGNGYILKNKLGLENVDLQLDDWNSKISGRAVDIATFDVILGCSWLRKVNPVINWKKDRMILKKRKKKTVLKTTWKPERSGVLQQSIKSEEQLKSLRMETMYGMSWHSQVENNLINREQCKKLTRQGAQSWLTLITENEISGQQLRTTAQGVGVGGSGVADEIENLCGEYTDLFKDDLPNQLPPERDVDHEIKLKDGATPPKKKLYRLSWQEEEVMKKQLNELLEKGFIRPSKSPYGAPVIFVKKKDGSLRMCVDYRSLNNMTVKNSYPLPRIDEMFDKLHGATIFSSLDCCSGYHQIRVKENDIEKTAFNTRYGQFEYLVVPFGLCNAPATFQTLVHNIFADFIDDSLLIFIDDILIFSKSETDHLRHLKQVFELCRKHELYLKPKKCRLGCSQINWVGHILKANGQAVESSKIRAIQAWPKLKNVTDVRSFLGMCGYYRKFVKGFASIATPLSKLMCKNIEFTWTKECEEAFQKLKQVMTETPVLQIPSRNKKFEVITDASNHAIGAVLEQEGRPVAYLSRALIPAEKKYATHEKEALAIVYAIKQWRAYLSGRHFVVWTDHHSLQHLQKQPNLTGRQARWMESLAEFDFDVKYVKGKYNVVADALSRPPTDEHLAVSVHIEMKQKWLQDVKAAYDDDVTTRMRLQELQQPSTHHVHSKYVVDNGLLYLVEHERRRLCVPRVNALLAKLLFELHDTPTAGHLGMDKVYDKAKESYYWPRMFRTIRKYINSCDVCQRCKPSQQSPAGLLQPLPVPDAPWDWLTMDFVVKLPTTPMGNEQCLVIVDRFTKFVKFIPLKATATASDVAIVFYNRVICQHGLPTKITSDRDTKFASKFWTVLQGKLGTQLAMSSAFHPQTDGESERVIKDLKIRLRMFSNYQQDNWEDNLSTLEMVHNSTKHSATGHSPSFLNSGREIVIPTMLMAKRKSEIGQPSLDSFIEARKTAWQDAKDSMTYAQDVMAQYANKKRRDVQFNIGDKVLLNAVNLKMNNRMKRPSYSLMEKFVGPYVVEAKENATSYRLKLPKTMRVWPVFHVSLLKLYTDPNTHFKGRKITPIPPEVVDGQEYFQIDKVLNKRIYRGKVQYFVKWLGYGDEDNTWQWKWMLDADNCAEYYQKWEKAQKQAKSL